MMEHGGRRYWPGCSRPRRTS